jgi:phosphotransferase system HPr (HPr) family protein
MSSKKDRPAVVQRTFRIKFCLGWLRTSSRFVRTCLQFKSSVAVACEKASADGKRMMGVMPLMAGPGKPITVTIRGPDAVGAMKTLADKIRELDTAYAEPS